MTRLRRLTLLLSSLLLALPAGAQDAINPRDAGDLDLYVLAGQSNMSGRGDVPSDQAPSDGIYVFGNDYRWRAAREPLDDPSGQVDSVSLDANAGFGPGLAFARALRTHRPDRAVGLIPCAKGATIIEQWRRSPDEDSLFGSCLKRTLAATPQGTLRGLLFLQGESDAHRGEEYNGHPRRPDTWADHFEAMVAGFREDVQRPDLPVVFAQIGPHDSPDRYVNWEVVKEQQASVRLPRTAMITTDDLSLRDRVHFDTASYEVIGQRFADAMAGLLAAPAIDLQGHRGARGLLPENTIPSVLEALDHGVNTVEVDVVITSDSEVLVSHEPWMSAAICRTPSGSDIAEEDEHSYNIFQLSADEVAAFDCGSRGHDGFPEQRPTAVSKPLLRQVLRVADGYAKRMGRALPRYNVEVKSNPDNDGIYHPEPSVFVRLVWEVLDDEEVLDRTTVQSFDPRALRALREVDPTLRLALLVSNDLGYHANLERLGFVPDAYSPDQRLVDAALIEAAHADGVDVIPWTVNERPAMDELLRLGVDGLITDYPGKGRAAVDEFLRTRNKPSK